MLWGYLVQLAIQLCLQWQCAIKTPNFHEYIFESSVKLTDAWVLHLLSYRLLVAGLEGNSLLCYYCYQWMFDYICCLNLEYCLCLFFTSQACLFSACCLWIATYFPLFCGITVFVVVCQLCHCWLLIHLGFLCLACLAELDHFLTLQNTCTTYFVINCSTTNA